MAEQTKIHIVKKKQQRKAIIVGMVIAAGLGAMYYFATAASIDSENHHEKPTHYVSPLDQIDAQSVVLERTQKQLRDAETKTEKLQQKVDSMLNTKQAENKDTESNLNKRIDELEKKLQTVSENKSITSQEAAQGIVPGIYPGAMLPAAMPPISQEGQGMIREDRLTLAPTEAEIKDKQPLKNPDTYVPPGTFAKAVIIGGADVSAAVNAQANPKVMLFRFIENGTLPNHKKSHLKDCMAVGRATGDISSERGSIPVEKLSCVFNNNEIVDLQVDAIVFGPDGKVDVRGNVREGGQQYVGRAFAAGTLSGLSEGLSQTYTVNSISPEGNVQTVNSGKIFQYGTAKGAGKAMDKLADYQMRKAEQFHPIIQLSPGTVVDIVFQMGFFLDGKKHEETDNKTVGNYSNEKTRTPTLFPAAPSYNELQELPLSRTQIERIEKYNKELGLRVERQPAGT